MIWKNIRTVLPFSEFRKYTQRHTDYCTFNTERWRVRICVSQMGSQFFQPGSYSISKSVSHKQWISHLKNQLFVPTRNDTSEVFWEPYEPIPLTISKEMLLVLLKVNGSYCQTPLIMLKERKSFSRRIKYFLQLFLVFVFNGCNFEIYSSCKSWAGWMGLLFLQIIGFIVPSGQLCGLFLPISLSILYHQP